MNDLEDRIRRGLGTAADSQGIPPTSTPWCPAEWRSYVDAGPSAAPRSWRSLSSGRSAA